MNNAFHSKKHVLTISEIMEWHENVKKSIEDYKNRILSKRINIKTEYPLFFGMTKHEISAYFSNMVQELEYATTLKLLTCSEAALRIDFHDRRIKGKKIDKIAKYFKEIYKQRKKENKSKNIRLEKDILDIWQENPNVNNKGIDDYKRVLKYRHWLAHGRAWSPKLAEDYDLNRVLTIITGLFETLPNFEWIIGDELDYPVKSI